MRVLLLGAVHNVAARGAGGHEGVAGDGGGGFLLGADAEELLVVAAGFF